MNVLKRGPCTDPVPWCHRFRTTVEAVAISEEICESYDLGAESVFTRAQVELSGEEQLWLADNLRISIREAEPVVRVRVHRRHELPGGWKLRLRYEDDRLSSGFVTVTEELIRWSHGKRSLVIVAALDFTQEEAEWLLFRLERALGAERSAPCL